MRGAPLPTAGATGCSARSSATRPISRFSFAASNITWLVAEGLNGAAATAAAAASASPTPAAAAATSATTSAAVAPAGQRPASRRAHGWTVAGWSAAHAIPARRFAASSSVT
eukprot:180151-Chlamydomonas_euryale.AAC.1